MMKPTFRSIVAFSLTLMQSTSAQTLSGVSGDMPSQAGILQESLSVSAGGTNLNGGTTYVEVDAITSDVIIEPYTTLTVYSAPTTLTETFVEDASGRAGSIPIMFTISPSTTATEAFVTCGFGADGRGTCVETILGQSGIFGAFTFSGSVVPFYTLPATPSAACHSVVRVAPWIVLPAIFVAIFRALFHL
ncbi:hypothetical protein B0H19DRAFT_1265028 [Mycena capillaripes]|nr:hypothetical protein B0H19DRAFT_1265028 [Mycena capillaripes]